MTMALGGGGWLASHPGRLYPRERPGTHFTGGLVGPRAGLDRCGKSRPHRVRSPDRPARSESLYRLSCPGPGLDKKADKRFRYNAFLSSLVISSHALTEVRYVLYVIFYGKVQSSPHILPISLKRPIHCQLN
jgi:hypothetical protein